MQQHLGTHLLHTKAMFFVFILHEIKLLFLKTAYIREIMFCSSWFFVTIIGPKSPVWAREKGEKRSHLECQNNTKSAFLTCFPPRFGHLGGFFRPFSLEKHQPNGPAEVQCKFFGPISGLNFGRWILGGEFLEGEFFRGPLLLEKTESKNSTQEFGSNIRAPKIRFPESGPKFGFRRCKIPSAEICPWKNRRKKSTPKSTAKFKSEFGSFVARIHCARIRPLKLIEVGVGFGNGNRS